MSRRALLAEDDVNLRTLLVQVLEQGGYTVVAAANGREAWEHLCDQEPEVVVTDIRMPERTGLDVLEQLRREGSFVPVVLMSGCIDGVEQLASFHGAVVLAKPFCGPELLRAIELAPEVAAKAFLALSEPLRTAG